MAGGVCEFVKRGRGPLGRSVEFRDGEAGLDFEAPRFPRNLPLWNAMVPPTGRVLFKGTLRDFPRLIQLELTDRSESSRLIGTHSVKRRESSILRAGPR